MKRFFTLAMIAAVALSGAAATIAKRLPAGAKFDASLVPAKRLISVYKSKLNAAATTIAKAEEDDEVIELPVPTGVKFTQNAKGGLDITWDNVDGANYYQAVSSMIAPVSAGDNFTLVNADFSNTQSTGTLQSPEYSDYMTETYTQFPGANFILPCYVSGAVGVEDYYYYAWFGYYAGIETEIYDLSVAKDKKVKVELEVASGTAADMYFDLFIWSDDEGDFVCADSYVKEAVGSTFQKISFELTGVNEESIFSIYPFGDPETYEFDGNLFFRSIKMTIQAGEAGEIEVPVLVWEGKESTTTIASDLVVPGNTYSAAVMAYQLDDEYDVVGESEYSDPVYYTAPAGVTDVTVDAANATPVYYNLQGMRMDNPEGVCIEVIGSKARKVVK